MEFFGFPIFSSLEGGMLVAVAAVIFVVGLLLTIKGGDWFVDSASWFAEATGIPKFVVGATVVSFATTLPELLVSVRAAMNGSAQLAIGNAVGSVTANTTLIMGVSLVALAGVVGRKSFSFKGGLFLAMKGSNGLEEDREVIGLLLQHPIHTGEIDDRNQCVADQRSDRRTLDVDGGVTDQ